MALPLIIWGGVAAAGAIGALVLRDRVTGNSDDDSGAPIPAPNSPVAVARGVNAAFPLITTGLALYGAYTVYSRYLR